MSWWIGILAAVLLVIVNKYWAPRTLRKLTFRGKCSHIMAEPGEIVTWSGTVENQSRIPALFVRLREIFPGECRPEAEEKWVNAHCQRGLYQWTCEERFSVSPRRSRTVSVELSFDKRGEYRLGDHRVAAGDLLGIGEDGFAGEGSSIVIVPEKSKNAGALVAVGGFLGDISVRRFILEDPVLTVGFRDYTGREPMKSISWTRTAMTGSLQVRQFDHTAEQTVMILLNVEGGTPEQLEECFRLMRSACEQLEKQKIPFGLRTNGNLPGAVSKLFWMAEGLGGSHLNTILYALGRADYSCFHSLQYLVNQTIQHRKNNESYIVITPPVGDRGHALLRKLEAAAGNPVCVLTAGGEEAKV